jgi:hypothetical protein
MFTAVQRLQLPVDLVTDERDRLPSGETFGSLSPSLGKGFVERRSPGKSDPSAAIKKIAVPPTQLPHYRRVVAIGSETRDDPRRRHSGVTSCASMPSAFTMADPAVVRSFELIVGSNAISVPSETSRLYGIAGQVRE